MSTDNSGRKDYSWDFSGKGSSTRKSSTSSSYGRTDRGTGQGYSQNRTGQRNGSYTGSSSGRRSSAGAYGGYSGTGNRRTGTGSSGRGSAAPSGYSSAKTGSASSRSTAASSRPAGTSSKTTSASSKPAGGSGYIFNDSISSTAGSKKTGTASSERIRRLERKPLRRSERQSGRSVPLQYKIMRLIRRNQKAAIAAAVVFVLLLALILKATLFKSEDTSKQAVAPGQTQEAVAGNTGTEAEAVTTAAAEAEPQTEAQASGKPHDADGDGINDQEDILQGAKDYVATKPQYKSKYYKGGYPDDEYGVCTDVVAYGFLAAGYDLRELVDADIAESPESYKLEDAPDPNIDFRRVKNLKVYFDRHAESLTTDIYDFDEWQGGDIVTFAAHIGIVSDKRGEDGVNLLIHHGYKGQKDYENDWLSNADDITGHYRVNYD